MALSSGSQLGPYTVNSWVSGGAGSAPWIWPVWRADGRRVILRRPDGVALVDVDTEANRLLVPVGGLITGKRVGVSHDNRWITYTETATDGDIGMATIKSGDTK
jgi:hypothetical protein